MRRRVPPRPRLRDSKGGEPPQVFPVDMNLVKGILREFDRGAYGEEFRGDRLAKIAVLGKGSTSTVWKVVDVDYLRVVAVKEMVVCNSKESAILRHELSVLNPQMQRLIPPKTWRLSGRKSKSAAVAAAAVSRMNGNSPATTAATAAAAAADGSTSTSTSTSQRKNNGGRGGGWGGGGGKGKAHAGGGGGGGGGSSGSRKGEASSLERPGKCAYMPCYYGSFVSQDDAGRPCVSIVLEHVSGVDLAKWTEEMGGTSSGAARGGRWPVSQAAAATAGGTGTGAGAGAGTGTMLTPTARRASAQPTPPRARPPPRPPEPEVWLARVCRDMLEALRYLHERRRIHRDVKPGNLLLGPEGARLVDFGSTIGEEEGEGDRMHGTVRFMSPERLCAKPYRPSSDLWAAALTVASAALGENPIPHSHNEFENAEYAEAAFRLVREHPASSGLSPRLLNFLKAALESDPDKRPTVEQMLAHPFVSPNPAEDSEGDFVGGGGGFLGAVRRSGSVLNLGGRKKDDERAARTAAVAAALEKSKEKQQRLLSSAFSSLSSSGGGGGGGGGGDRLDEAWSEQVKEALRRLARESIGEIDASDLIRRILTARKSRWKNAMGHGRYSLKCVDYSHLAAALDVSSAELRSLFGTLLTNMDGESGESSGSWSSPGDTPRSSCSPPPAMLPPLGAAGASSGGNANRSRSNSRETEGGAPPSPLRFPRRSPLPRRRPARLVLSPGAETPRPVSGVSATSGVTALSATGCCSLTPAGGAAAARAALAEGSPADLPVQRSVSAATWTRGWPGINRSRRPGDGRRSVSGVFATRSGAAARAATPRKGGGPAVVVVVGGGGETGGERGGGGAWWKWGQRPRLRPRVFKPGGGGYSGGGGSSSSSSIAEEVRTTEPPSAASRAATAATPPLSKFDEEADGSVGGRELPPGAAERDIDLGAVVGSESGPGTRQMRTHEARFCVCDGPGPAWGGGS